MGYKFRKRKIRFKFQVQLSNKMTEQLLDVRCSIVVSIRVCRTRDPGSIPGGGVFSSIFV